MSASIDLGLVASELRSERGPYVGTPPPSSAPPRWSRDVRLDRLLAELHAGFGFQRWWPATTPFEVIVGAILTQNTAWRNVEYALANLRAADLLSPHRLIECEPELLHATVRPSGTFKAKARKLVEISKWYLDVGGLRALRERELEPLRDELLEVWGVGPETADSILCYAAGRPTAVVDTYTRRILSRHELCDGQGEYEELRHWLGERLTPEPFVFEEFHALFVRVGYDHCKPTAKCATCPVQTPHALRGTDNRPNKV